MGERSIRRPAGAEELPEELDVVEAKRVNRGTEDADGEVDEEELPPVFGHAFVVGIAGTDAFIRSTNGQPGMVKEGGEFGGIKLLRIGTNRVLIEDAGEKKELLIFEGAGGESLLSK